MYTTDFRNIQQQQGMGYTNGQSAPFSQWPAQQTHPYTQQGLPFANPYWPTTPFAQTGMPWNPWMNASIPPQINPWMTTPYAWTQPNAISQPAPFRLRENDSHIFCDIFVPQLTMGDVEVEICGNRIVCRTRVPLRLNQAYGQNSWQGLNQPRNLEIFELPDGRVEFSWLCPVTFVSKDVEATFRESYLCIYIPKSDVVTPRQSVKITKESTTRRSDMNS